MITLAVPMRPHVVIGRGVNGLPTVHLRGMGDGVCYDATSGDAIACPDGSSSGSSDSSSGDSAFSSMTAAQQAAFLAAGGSPSGGSSTVNLTALAAAISAASTGAVNAYKATQSPYYLPGSNTLYNPATGQLTNQVGVTASSATPLLIGMVLIGAVLIFAMKK